MKTHCAILCVMFVIPTLFASAEGAVEPMNTVNGYLLLDDFSTERSALDTEWKGFTDQVMGGVSQMSVTRIPDPEGNFVRMKGRVSTKNNGGFIQVRLIVRSPKLPSGGSPYQGVRLLVRGKGSGYYVFLRSTGMVLPWKYYAAPVPVSGEWQIVELPWAEFKPGDYGRMGEFNPRRLRSLALVAYGKDFDAEIDIKEVGLY